MTSRWANPINNNFLYDKEANLLPLGSVQFYGADGSTPLAVYSDPELTASLGSYIDADAFGLLPDFHMAAGTQYKMVAYDAIGGAGGAGAIKWTRDDVFGLDSSVDTRLDDIEASVASLENTGRNSIINGGCSAKNIDGDAAVIAAPSLTTSFAEGQAVGVRAKVANVTAGTQAIGYSADVASGAYLHLSGVTTNNAAATADAMFQVISGEACRFINQQATFRCKVYHDIGSAKDFTITVAVLNSRDDVSAYTTVLAGSATSVSDITWTSVSLTVPDLGDCSNGIVVIVSGAVGTITTKNIRFTEAQMDLGGVLAAFTETDPVISEGSLNFEKYATRHVTQEIAEFAQRGGSQPWLNGIGAITTYTSGSGNFTVPDGVYRVKYVITGGGGGGAGIAGSPANGSVGGDTVFNTTITAGGGLGGVVNGDGGVGGTASGGSININGGGGSAGSGTAASQPGGSSIWGGGAKGKSSDASAEDSTVYGSGGPGAVSSAASSGGGGAGATCIGILSVTPAQLIPYSVGAGGAGGTGTRIGGDGGSGFILLEY